VVIVVVIVVVIAEDLHILLVVAESQLMDKVHTAAVAIEANEAEAENLTVQEATKTLSFEPWKHRFQGSYLLSPFRQIAKLILIFFHYFPV
jgi:hypothetical protein